MSDVYVVGYPRSGNTWLSRLLADALNSPLVGLGKQAIPIGQEGLDRTGPHTVHQLHLVPRYDPDYTEAVPGPYTFAPDCWEDERVVLIMRDPRDVAVSCRHYWNIATLKQAIKAMYNRDWPIAVPSNWIEYNRLWLSLSGVQVVRYETLLAETLPTLSNLLASMHLEPVNDLANVIERQSFSVRQKQFKELQDNRKHWHPYGTGVQLQNLRKGQAGDWRNHFTRSDGELFHGYFYRAMKALDYEDNPAWWEGLPEERE